MKKKINILVISTGNYPSNLASNIRLLLMLEGLIQKDVNIELLSILSNIKTNNIKIFKNYIKIHFLVQSNTKNNFLKSFLHIKAYFLIIKKFIKFKKFEGEKIIFLKLDHFYHLFPIFLITILFNFKIIYERNEYPFLHYKNNIYYNFKKFIFLKLIVPKFNKLFVISNNLKVYFGKYYKKNIQIIPIIVDSERFKQDKIKVFNFPYLAYCGNIGINKDGVGIMIESFAKISKQFHNVKLVIVGNDKKNKDIEILNSIIKKYEIEEKVIFTGEISNEEMPRILNYAEALLLSRPNNIQAKYGLPTKLGEYLMTGKPVVVTSVGDIPLYLKDNESSYIAEPDSIESFANKILEVLNNPVKAKEIGEQGKKVCEMYFDYKYQVNILHKYIIQS